VVYALVVDGWKVAIAARRVEQAQEVAEQFGNCTTMTFNFSTLQLSDFQLLVNTTPLGMTPDIHSSPLPENISLPRHLSIYDLVYNPAETKLVRDARAQGLQATTGLGMLIEQAALAFEIWTGDQAPREAMLDAVDLTAH
jgi:shikimate dehydrogenase